jgi:hypothetical protein
MLGIPFVIRRFSERGTEDQTVYLRSRRCGEAGVKMRKAIRDYHAAQFAQMKAAGKAGAITAKAIQAACDEKQARKKGVLESLDQEQEAAMADATQQAALALDLATTITRMALADNYGNDKADEIIDGMTDHEMHSVVKTIELGALPKDFFQPPGTQPNPSTTPPSGAGQEKSS